MRNFIFILISIISINCFSQNDRTKQIKKSKQTMNKKAMVKNDKPDKDFIVSKKITLEWENDGVKNRRVTRVYRSCKDFYELNSTIDEEKVKCTESAVYQGTGCQVSAGNMENISDCSTIICKTCESCREFVELMAGEGTAILNCRKTENGYEGDVEKFTLVRKLHKMDPDKMKIKN